MAFSNADDAVSEWLVGDRTGCVVLKGTRKSPQFHNTSSIDLILQHFCGEWRSARCAS